MLGTENISLSFTKRFACRHTVVDTKIFLLPFPLHRLHKVGVGRVMVSRQKRQTQSLPPEFRLSSARKQLRIHESCALVAQDLQEAKDLIN